jgi:hypothetical protein
MNSKEKVLYCRQVNPSRFCFYSMPAYSRIEIRLRGPQRVLWPAHSTLVKDAQMLLAGAALALQRDQAIHSRLHVHQVIACLSRSKSVIQFLLRL